MTHVRDTSYLFSIANPYLYNKIFCIAIIEEMMQHKSQADNFLSGDIVLLFQSKQVINIEKQPIVFSEISQ